MWYVESRFNPNKHPLIPDGFPWLTSDIEINNGIEIGEAEFISLISSFDLTAYNASINQATQAAILTKQVDAKILQYQNAATQLLRELYTENTIGGITTAQSDQLMDLYADVILRIKEGLYPTAIYRLRQKTPIGFVTQDLIDNWINKITQFMV